MAKIDIVLPVYNEENQIKKSVEKILQWIHQQSEHKWRIIIVDNGSTDNTPFIAKQLGQKYPEQVEALIIKEKGRGIAVRTAWLNSMADVCSYLDIDLANNLPVLPELVGLIIGKKADITYGSKWHSKSLVDQKFLRRILSWNYNFILRHFLGLDVSDAQCGFKAISQEAVKKLIPLVQDNKWFFDTELLLIAQENGYRLYEVPVQCFENNAKSSVSVFNTILVLLRDVWSMKKRGVPKID